MSHRQRRFLYFALRHDIKRNITSVVEAMLAQHPVQAVRTAVFKQFRRLAFSQEEVTQRWERLEQQVPALRDDRLHSTAVPSGDTDTMGAAPCEAVDGISYLSDILELCPTLEDSLTDPETHEELLHDAFHGSLSPSVTSTDVVKVDIQHRSREPMAWVHPNMPLLRRCSYAKPLYLSRMHVHNSHISPLF